MGASNVYCTASGISACRVCAPTGRYKIQTYSSGGSYSPQYQNFTISVYCPGNKKSTYSSWQTYGSAKFSASYSAWPAANLLARPSVTYNADKGWVRYEWCDDQGKKGAWVTRWEGSY
jgi:hypothetical protein